MQEERLGAEQVALVKILQTHGVVVRGGAEHGRKLVDALLVCRTLTMSRFIASPLCLSCLVLCCTASGQPLFLKGWCASRTGSKRTRWTCKRRGGKNMWRKNIRSDARLLASSPVMGDAADLAPAGGHCVAAARNVDYGSP